MVQATVRGVPSAWLYRPTDGTYQPDDGGAPVRDELLRALPERAGGEVTFTCVPPGSGVRMALDRDGDGIYNRRDRCPDDPGC